MLRSVLEAPLPRARAVPLSNRLWSLAKALSGAVRPLLGEDTGEADVQILTDELWALLHGMSALYVDRVAPFELARVTNARYDVDPGRLYETRCASQTTGVAPA